AAAERLDRVRPQLAGMKNTLVQGEFYRGAGESQQLARNLSAAEREFRYAVALAENDRNSLTSESDRLSWTHQWAGTYLEFMDVLLQEGKSQEALAVWRLYRNDERRRAAGDRPADDFDAEAAFQSLQRSLQQESEALNRSLNQWKDRTLVSLALVPHGLAVWTL